MATSSLLMAHPTRVVSGSSRKQQAASLMSLPSVMHTAVHQICTPAPHRMSAPQLVRPLLPPVRFQVGEGAAQQQPAQPKQKTKPRNIILALDNSMESDIAVEWAVQNLLRSEDQVHIFHMAPGVHMDHVFTTPNGHLIKVTNAMAEAMQEKLRGEGGRLAQQLVARYGPRLSQLKVELHAHVLPMSGPVSKANIGQALCLQAETLEAAAVVVASHSHGGLAEFIRGSVADYAVKHATCPVAVLHAPAAKGSTPTPAAGEPRHLVVAVDSTDESLAACTWVLDNMYHKGDKLHLVHVVPCLPLSVPVTGSDFLLYSGLEGEPGLLEKRQEQAEEEARTWQKQEAQRFKELMDKRGVPHSFDIMVQYTDDPVVAISGSICSIAEELGASAVVLGHHEQSAVTEFFLGSVTSQVTHHCTAPVVVLHGSSKASQ